MSYNKKQDFERFRKIIREKNAEIDELKKKISKLENIIEKEYSNLKIIINKTPALIYQKDNKGNYIFVNKAFEELTGKSKEEILGKNDFELFDENSAKNLLLNDNKIKFENRTLQFEEEILIDNKVKSYLSMKSPLQDNLSDEDGISGITIDISDRVRILNSLFEREGLLRTVIESATDPIFAKDTNLRYKRVNSAMEKLFDKNRTFILGKNDKELFNDEQAEYLKDGDISVLGGSKHETHFTKNINGEKHYFHLIKVPLQDNLGNVNGICGVIRDITKTKKAELKSNMLAKVVEQVGECVVIVDLEGNIEYTNKAFEEITGYEVKEAIGRNPRFLQSGQHSPEFYKELWNKISNGEVWRGVFHNKRKDGSIYYENAVIFPIKNDEEEIVKYAAVKMDLTFIDVLDDYRKSLEKKAKFNAI